MPQQKQIPVKVERISSQQKHSVLEQAALAAQLGDWRISSVTIQYLESEAKISSQITVSMGLLNLSDKPLTLTFPHGQFFTLEITDTLGTPAFKSPPPSGAPSTATLAPSLGVSWTATFSLDPAKFQAGKEYRITGSLNATNFPGTASIRLVPG